MGAALGWISFLGSSSSLFLMPFYLQRALEYPSKDVGLIMSLPTLANRLLPAKPCRERGKTRRYNILRKVDWLPWAGINSPHSGDKPRPMDRKSVYSRILRAFLTLTGPS